jgi:hypothetical protein
MTAPFNYTGISDRNRNYPTHVIQVASGASFVVLDIKSDEVLALELLLYMHVNRENAKCYIGRTVIRAGARFAYGYGYRMQRAMAAAINCHGWASFDSYVLALGDDDASLSNLEVRAIKDVGGHQDKRNYNLSPGGEIVADNGRPVIAVHMPTMSTLRLSRWMNLVPCVGLWQTEVVLVHRAMCVGEFEIVPNDKIELANI